MSNNEDDVLRRMLGDTLGDIMGESKQPAPKMSADEKIARLKASCLQLDTVNLFKVGDVVDWKPTLSIMRSTGPFLFRRYLPADEIKRFDTDPASAFYCELGDCVIADLAESPLAPHSLIEWTVPSRRLANLSVASNGADADSSVVPMRRPIVREN